MGRHNLTYRLPVSCIRVDGTITRVVDDVLPAPDPAPQATVSLYVGTVERDQTLAVKVGFLRDTSVSLELTDDRRLRSTDVESTGQLGRVVLGVLGAGATVAGLVTSGPAGALGAAATASAAAGLEFGVVWRPAEVKLKDPLTEAYAEAHPQPAALRERYTQLVTSTVEAISLLAERLVVGGEDRERLRHVAELRQLQALLPFLRAELDTCNEHYAAWRATTLTTTVEAYERGFTLDVLRDAAVSVSKAGAVSIGADAHPAVRAAWDKLGVAVTMDPPGVPVEPEPETHANAVLVRIPRRVRIGVYERIGRTAMARLREERPHLVMDDACETQVVKLRRSLWARRSVRLEFSDLGALTSYKQTAQSSAAAAADTFGGLPAAVGGGLEQATKIRTQLSTLRDAGLNEQLAHTKAEVELKQKQLTQAELAATDKDYAELARLKQQAEILTQQKAIGDASPAAPTANALELAELKRQLELLSVQREVAVATRQLEAEQELGSLRLEFERMQARAATDGK